MPSGRRSRATTQQKRGASTLSSKPAPPALPKQSSVPPQRVPQQQTGVGAAQSQGPGLFGQMASTAAGVAVGHTLGAGISGLFGGGSSASETAQDQPQLNSQAPGHSAYQTSNQSTGAASCEVDAKALTRCLEQNNHNIEACQWYLENLKACQQMASQF
ncbi:hypothetical protein G9A89_015706 [Geosiphon pyriformis]|nr:hypothetical protein G9A89_015706 [Geosiphon pyriformis]